MARGERLRVGVVSAHYPPNFVSGGTLQPQRLARSLATRGHDVWVLAGWMGRGRTPLQVWDEPDETGLPVRWLNIGPYLAWTDRRAFDNGPARDAVARWMADIRPDVVHVHSLQGIGALVVPAAREAGAKVVVTMHDFWWACARQFLVDRDNRPCCPVVAVGDCSCEVDREWADDRHAFLLEQLHAADVVLTPSAGAARVLAANGVPEPRLRIDPNGAVETDRCSPVPDRRDHGLVRFTFSGGANPLKGAAVLVAATRYLDSLKHWRLRLYGVSPAELERMGHGPPAAPIEPAAAYAPEALGGVLAETDVVVVPSLAQETYSLTVQEALRAGVPVISSATPGPSGLIMDGVNGLLVPAGDERALGQSMAKVVAEPDLLARLREGCREHPPTVPTLAEQAIGHERLYRELLRSPSADSPDRGGVKRVLFVVGIDGAPLRYRAHLPAEGLALYGVHADVRHYRALDLDERADEADVVVVYRVPSTGQILDLIDRLRQRGVTVLFDADDLIFDPDIAAEVPALARMPEDEARHWLQGVRRYRATLEACEGFIASTPLLAAEATRLTGLPSARFDNGVGVLVGRRSAAELARARRPGPVRIGYLSGSDAHADDWFLVEPAVMSVLDRCPEVELWLGGRLPPTPELDRYGARVRRFGFAPWPVVPGVLRDLDVNLAPLTPGSRFNEAKSAVKWLEAALTATVTVASPTGPFSDAIEHERTGMLSDADGWATVVHRLVTDAVLRDEIGHRAREAALFRWPPHRQGRRYLDLLEAARAAPAPARPRPSVPDDLAVDEPPLALELEPYELTAAAHGHPLLGRRRPRRAEWLRLRIETVAGRHRSGRPERPHVSR